MKIVCLPLIFPVFLFAASLPLPAPENLRVVYAEQSLEITWDSLPDVEGYHVYDSLVFPGLKTKPVRINSTLITSSPRFSYIWTLEKGVRIRKIKGYEHHIFVTGLFNVKGKTKEGRRSKMADNRYFKNFKLMTTRTHLESVFIPSQTCAFLPIEKKSNGRDDFIRFMEGPGTVLANRIKKTIDPLTVGACAPVSTVLLNLLGDFNLIAYRIEGVFLKEYHTFVVIPVDSVEYILDFTADQFVPGVSPVFFPRDVAFLDTSGRLSKEGAPVYRVEKIYSQEQSRLVDGKIAEDYRALYESVLSTIKKKNPKKEESWK